VLAFIVFSILLDFNVLLNLSSFLSSLALRCFVSLKKSGRNFFRISSALETLIFRLTFSFFLSIQFNYKNIKFNLKFY